MSPHIANIMSTQITGFRWVGLLFFTPWLLYNKMWVEAAIVVFNFFITSSMCIRLNPFFFLNQAVELGRKQFIHELALLKEVSKKTVQRIK
jgi:hypothetical protein